MTLERPGRQDRQAEPRQQAPPQFSPDGRWWWDGYRWVPVARPAAGSPQRAGRALAYWALGVGLFTLVWATPMWVIGIADRSQTETGVGWRDVGALAVLTSPGVVLGVLALRRGHGVPKALKTDLRTAAWAGILSSALAFVLLAVLIRSVA